MVGQWVRETGSHLVEQKQLLESYQVYVTQRARLELGESYLGTHDFRMLMETIESFSSLFVEKVTDAQRGGVGTGLETSRSEVDLEVTEI